MKNASLKEILKKIEKQVNLNTEKIEELMYGDLLELSYGNLENDYVCFYHPLLGEGDDISIDVLYVTQIVCQALYDVCNMLPDQGDQVTEVKLSISGVRVVFKIDSLALSTNTTDTRYFNSNSELYKRVYDNLEESDTYIRFNNSTLLLNITSSSQIFSMMGYNNENPKYYKNAFSIIFLSQHVPGFP